MVKIKMTRKAITQNFGNIRCAGSAICRICYPTTSRARIPAEFTAGILTFMMCTA